MAQQTSFRPSNPRLVITGHDEQGHEIIVKDSLNETNPVGDGTYLSPLWSSNQSPAAIDSDAKMAPDPADANAGSFFNTYDLPPHYNGPMHRTVTLDYIVVLRGEVVLTFQNGKEVTLRHGDTIVQQGTMHSWSNKSKEWARITSVMLPAKPIVVGDEELRPFWPF